MVQVGRYLYVAVIWLFVAFLAVQIFYAGQGLFAVPPNMETHKGFGWLVHLLDLALIAVALIAQVGRPTIWWVLALFVTSAIQPFLPEMRVDAPFFAALHPLNAVVISLIAVKLALESLRFLRSPEAVA